MNVVQYLKEVYGYGVPILLKDIRIGGKSNAAIRQELSRAVKNGDIIRDGEGIYSFEDSNDVSKTVTFQDIVKKKFVKDDLGLEGLDFNVYGYFTGLSFLNYLGISQQVPAVLEVVTNRTSSKRYYQNLGMVAIVRKGKTTIHCNNYKALQFFDVFYYLDEEEIEEHKGKLIKYVQDNLTEEDFIKYIKFYPLRIQKIIVERGFINAFRK